MTDRTEVTVSPGNLESFSTWIQGIADDWNDPASNAMKFYRSKEDNDNWPQFGEFTSATNLQSLYDGKFPLMQKACDDMYTTLDRLAYAAKKLSEKYKNTEELSGLEVAEVDKLLQDTFKPPQQPGEDGQPPADGQQPS